MNKAENALREIQAMGELQNMGSPIHSLAPLAKLVITVSYIFTVMSFSPYDMTGLFVMILYPVIAYQISGISIPVSYTHLTLPTN